VENLLGDFIHAIKELKKTINLEVSIVKSNSVSPALYDSYEEYFDKVYTNEDLVSALKTADMAIASSGTVTLACALFEVPTVVCYRVSFINYFIYQTFITYTGPGSLANIVHDCSVFPELIQERSTPFNIVTHIKKWYNDIGEYRRIKALLSTTKTLISGDNLDVPSFMATIVNQTYEKKSH
jgi:lipid-A-disaccharide synthase